MSNVEAVKLIYVQEKGYNDDIEMARWKHRTPLEKSNCLTDRQEEKVTASRVIYLVSLSQRPLNGETIC